jgi:hypothetical protein
MGIGSFALPITSGTTSTPYPYTYPSDWVSITGVPNNEIYLATCDAGLATVSFTVTTSTGTYNVDWGDGTSTTGITSNTQAQKTYTFGSGLTGTTLPNTTTFRCRIYTTGGTITRFFISKASTIAGLQLQPILAANFGTTGLTSMANAFFASTSANYCGMLEAVYLPSSLNSVTTMSSTFEYCRALQYVLMPTSMSGITSFSRTFHTAISLQYVILPTTLGTSFTMANMFQSSGIKRVDFPTIMNGCTSTTLMFNSSPSLEEVNLPTSMTGCTNFGNMFGGAYGLQEVIFPTTLSSSSINFGQMFDDCRSLKYFEFPAAASVANTLSATFNQNYQLEYVIFPSTMNSCSTMQTTFNRCENLKYVLFPTSMTSLTNMNATFRFCYSLEDLSLPILSGVTNVSECFNQASAVRVVTNIENLGRTSGSTVNADNFFSFNEAMTGLTTNQYFSKFQFQGSTTIKTKLTSLRFLNTLSGAWGGSSPQISIPYNDLGQAALVQVFNDLPTVTSKTIDITGCTGAAALTAPERAIATGKGWTITG